MTPAARDAGADIPLRGTVGDAEHTAGTQKRGRHAKSRHGRMRHHAATPARGKWPTYPKAGYPAAA